MNLPPPPPPAPPPISPSSPPYAGAQHRQRPAPPTIFTNVPNVYSPTTAVPASAIVPQSATRAFLSPGGGNSSMTSYNPQEWGRTPSGAGGGAYIPHTAAAAQARARGTRELTGLEAQMPEPPPPYSASSSPAPHTATHNSPHSATSAHSQTISPIAVSHDAAHQTPLASSNRLSNFPTSTISYPHQSPPSSFPPPPGSQRDRSGSRTRGVFSSISAITSRHRGSENASPAGRVDLYQRQRGGSSTGPPPPAVHRPIYQSADLPIRPPSSSRSVSVGLAGTAVDASRGTSRDRSASNWQPGMPLPPPPPGAPPPGPRSQSVDRASDRGSEPVTQNVLAPVPQRHLGALLSPVPATPADWRDEPSPQPNASTEAEVDAQRLGLSLNTRADHRGFNQRDANETSIMSAIEPRVMPANSSVVRDGFGRMAPQRESSTKGIRERRIESRSKIREPQTAIEPSSTSPWSEEAKPANLILSSTNGGMISRRRHVPKAATSPLVSGTPHTPASARDGVITGELNALDSATRSAPLGNGTAAASGLTSLSSPDVEARERKTQSARPDIGNYPNTVLPTPTSAALDSAKSMPADRHSYTSLDAGVRLVASPSNPLERPDSRVSYNGLDDFSRSSLARYRTFLERESAASDDLERLELFAAFFVGESRLRRDKYAQAFETLGSEVLDLTRDLWRSNSSSKRGKQPAARVDTRLSVGAGVATPLQDPSSASSAGDAAFTPRTEPDSPSSASSTGSMSRNQKQISYQPCLSPILSMAVSTVPDEEDSRGRAPSRWWEQSDEGRSVGYGGGRKIERSKRESKYMGVPRQTLENLQWDDEDSSAAGPSNYYSLGPDEYPVEKVGWHDESTPSAMSAFASLPRTPQPPKLDISRLITLPPPYPRHHPAVNNNHPELATIRMTLRTLTENPEKEELQARYMAERIDADLDPRAMDQRRRDMRRHIQHQVGEGLMSFAEAAQAETSFDESELKHFKGVAKSNFQSYQRVVMEPISAMINGKIATATQSIDILRTSLVDSASTHNPNTTQESGDELPELLEKITLMKWLFEAREYLHKTLFDLQTESDTLYGHVILAPYRAASNNTKVAEVSSFFVADRRDRELLFAQEILKRFEAFQAAVEDSVTRGVEAQLSAFWDIAPPLLEIVDKVPQDPKRLDGFDVVIPASELQENPSYVTFPMQYVYTLLTHAEKSAYQLIESQTNLLCLLHEVKTGVMVASIKAMQREREKRQAPGQDDASIAEHIEIVRREEDRKLTRDLKERVQLVEEQWRGALGSAMGDCRSRVRDWLVEIGGWDESLDD